MYHNDTFKTYDMPQYFPLKQDSYQKNFNKTNKIFDKYQSILFAAVNHSS
jgi:hypothetical protein